MKKENLVLSILVILTTVISCGKDKSNPPAPAELRVFNSTPWTFLNCTIDPSGTLSDNPGPAAHNFGEVDINTSTAYKTFAKLYRYSWVRLTMNNKIYYLKPYDYTGETVLESGRYTYKLSHNSVTDQLKLELIED